MIQGNPSLVLVGLMGAGKTTVGRLVAERLGLGFADTDRSVEQVAGTSVAEIFRTEGEEGFRRRERAAVAAACSRGSRVIATGGGALLDPQNRERLGRAGMLVWLDAPAAVLAQRLVRAGGEERPLLGAGKPGPGALGGPNPAAPNPAAPNPATPNPAGPNSAGADLAEQLASLLEARRGFYALAHHRVETGGRTAEEVAQEVAGLFEAWRTVRRVPVALGERSYEVLVGPGLLSQAGRLIRQAAGVGPGTRALVVTSAGVENLWLDPLRRALSDEGFSVYPLVVPDGEEAKNLEVLGQAYDACAEAGLDRQSVVVALGGGAVGDLAGLTAATFMRGVPFVQVPTTLLAQVDASVGGKVAINHPRGKNLIGAFYQPRLVLADTLTLTTLPERELRSGLAEVIKHGILAGPAYLELVSERLDSLLLPDAGALAEVVAGSCRIKAEVVQADEREAGLRANLNYGHTVGHALEAAAGFGGLLHGEAVALGMLVAARIGAARGWAPGLADDLEDLLARAGLPRRIPALPLNQVLEYLQRDKKAAGGRLVWVLARRFGEVERVQDVDLELVTRILVALGATA